MVGVPKALPEVLSNVLANYNFVDIASGTGYITFYAGDTVDLKLLSNSTYYADTVAESVNDGATVVYVLVLDHDFDVVLNRPLDVKGLGIVNIPLGILTSNGAYPVNAYVTTKLRKWDGVTETDIATNDSRVLTTNSTSLVYTMLAVDLSVANVTHFKKGETLRLSINVYGKCEATGTYKYAHDPKSRTTGWDTTGAVPSQLTFQCPVRLNL